MINYTIKNHHEKSFLRRWSILMRRWSIGSILKNGHKKENNKLRITKKNILESLALGVIRKEKSQK